MQKTAPLTVTVYGEDPEALRRAEKLALTRGNVTVQVKPLREAPPALVALYGRSRAERRAAMAASRRRLRRLH